MARGGRGTGKEQKESSSKRSGIVERAVEMYRACPKSVKTVRDNLALYQVETRIESKPLFEKSLRHGEFTLPNPYNRDDYNKLLGEFENLLNSMVLTGEIARSESIECTHCGRDLNTINQAFKTKDGELVYRVACRYCRKVQDGENLVLPEDYEVEKNLARVKGTAYTITEKGRARSDKEKAAAHAEQMAKMIENLREGSLNTKDNERAISQLISEEHPDSHIAAMTGSPSRLWEYAESFGYANKAQVEAARKSYHGNSWNYAGD